MTVPSVREMLEAAASVAGIDLKWSASGWHYTGNKPFNPHYDDGDSARLRSAGMMNVIWNEQAKHVEVSVGLDGQTFTEFFADHNYDRNAALRMATLRCTVEMARRMG
jgi:hypothetical protein